MFNFLKEKLKNLFGKKEKEAEKEKEEEKEKPEAEKKAEKKSFVPDVKEKKVEKKKTKETEKEQEEKAIKEIGEIIEEFEEKPVEIIKEAKEEVEEEQVQEIKEEHLIDMKEKSEETSEGKEGFFSRFKKKFTTTTITKEMYSQIFEKIELILLENNVALEVVEKIKKDLEKDIVDLEIKKGDLETAVQKALKEAIKRILIEPFDLIEKINEKQGVFVILFAGINGSGKTTSIAKIAYIFKQKGINSVIAAADTFRAASIEQLMKHGEKLDIKIVKQHYGADPAAVAFDAIEYAKAHKIKIVLIDTAGRMHTKKDLMREMEKIVRISKPDLKIFVGESITGNDATEQAKIFNETMNIDGIILSKADVDEKGGTALSVGYITGKPIIYLGTGQNYEDLEKFDKEKIIENLGF